MNWRAVRRRRFEMRRNEKLPQIFSNAVEPGFRCGIVAGKRPQKWIAHAQASVSASRFGPTTSGGGHQSASQKSQDRVWLPAKKNLRIRKKMNRKTTSRIEQPEPIEQRELIKPEG